MWFYKDLKKTILVFMCAARIVFTSEQLLWFYVPSRQLQCYRAAISPNTTLIIDLNEIRASVWFVLFGTL